MDPKTLGCDVGGLADTPAYTAFIVWHLESWNCSLDRPVTFKLVSRSHPPQLGTSIYSGTKTESTANMDFDSLKNQVSNLTLYDIKAGVRKVQNGTVVICDCDSDLTPKQPS